MTTSGKTHAATRMSLEAVVLRAASAVHSGIGRPKFNRLNRLIPVS